MSSIDISFVSYNHNSSYAVEEDFMDLGNLQLLTGERVRMLKKYTASQAQKVYSPLRENLINQTYSSPISTSLKKGKSFVSYAGGMPTVKTTGTTSFYAMSAVSATPQQAKGMADNYALVLAAPGGRPGSGTPAVGEVDMPIGGVAPLLFFAALYTAVRKFIHRKK